MSNRAVAILAGSALLVGVLIGRASATGNDATPTPQVEQAQGAVPDPKAYPRTRKGAATAAQAYDEALFRGAVAAADERRAVVNAISSSAMRDQIAKDEEEAAEIAAKLFDLPKDESQVVNRVAPLGYRVLSFTEDSARVEIWSLTLFGKPAVGQGVVPVFKTGTFDLAWERGAWRLAGTPQSKDGPAPLADNTQASTDVLNATKDLLGFSHAAR